MSYAGRYRPIDPTDEPSTNSNSGSEQLRGGSSSSSSTSGSTDTGSISSGYQLPTSSTTGNPQLPIRPYSVRPPIPTGGGSSAGRSMGIGVQQGGRTTEHSSPIPVPGSTISDSGSSVYPGQLRSGERPNYATIGSADLASQPDILGQLFPNLFESLLGSAGRSSEPGRNEQRKPSGDGRIRDRGTSGTKPVRGKSRRNAGQRRNVGK